MTRSIALCVSGLLFIAAPTSTAQGPLLSDAEVKEAIDTARGGGQYGLRLAEFNISGATGFVAWIYPPAEWVRNITAKAVGEFRTIALADITEADRSDVWRVQIFPSTPTKFTRNAIASASDVTHAVLRDQYSMESVIQPTSKEPFVTTLSNAMGAQASYTGLWVTFPGENVRKLWGPCQCNEFVLSVVGSNWRYDFEVKEKHFERLGASRRR